MKKIQALELVHFPQEAVFKYLQTAEQGLAALPGGMPDYADAFGHDFKAFDSALNDKPSEDQTSKLEALDARADLAYSLFVKQLKLSAQAPVAACKDAANRLLQIVGTSDPTALPYMEEYSAIKPIIAQIKALEPAVLEAALAQMWFDDLAQATQDFINLFNDIQRSKAAHSAEAIKAARLRAIISYGEAVEATNARLMMASTPELEALADKLNASLENLRKSAR